MQLIEHPPSVVIVAVDGDEIVLVHQTRPGARGQTVELPSGKLEAGETPVHAAARELAEECGFAAYSLRALGAFWAVPAYSTEYVHVFEATGLARVPGTRMDEDEDVEVERVAADRVPAALSDAVSLAAVALWQRTR